MLLGNKKNAGTCYNMKNFWAQYVKERRPHNILFTWSKTLDKSKGTVDILVA